MTSFSISDDIINQVDPRHNILGFFIDEAERVGGHVVSTHDSYRVVNDYQVLTQKLDPIYSAGRGFCFPTSQAA